MRRAVFLICVALSMCIVFAQNNSSNMKINFRINNGRVLEVTLVDWWHNPAMVVCTFLENYKLDNKIVVPFFTYGATTYLQQSVNKIYEVTPNSTHLQTYTSGSVEAWLKSINIIQ